MLLDRLLGRVLFPSAMLLFMLPAAMAQEPSHSHPVKDAQTHELFYRNWMRPDDQTKTCCGGHDCYPTEIKIIGGTVFAKRREDGKFIRVPQEKIETRRDNPDGRNHMCAPAPTPQHDMATVFCFALGSGI